MFLPLFSRYPAARFPGFYTPLLGPAAFSSPEIHVMRAFSPIGDGGIAGWRFFSPTLHSNFLNFSTPSSLLKLHFWLPKTFSSELSGAALRESTWRWVLSVPTRVLPPKSHQPLSTVSVPNRNGLVRRSTHALSLYNTLPRSPVCLLNNSGKNPKGVPPHFCTFVEGSPSTPFLLYLPRPPLPSSFFL